MIHRYLNIFLFISIVFLTNSSYAQDNLNNYLKIAAENNPELKGLFNQYMAALEKVPQVGALPDPTLAFGYFALPVQTRVGAQRFNISVSQMFPWFGKLTAQKRAAAEMAKAKYEMFEDAKARLFLQVKSTYNNLYVLHKSARIAKDNLDLLHSFREIAKIKYESGKAGLVDVLRADMEIAELENQLLYIQDSEGPLVAKFEQLLNMSFNGQVSFPDTLHKDTLNMAKVAIKDSILNESPRLKMLEHQLLSWQKQLDVAKKSGLPSFSLGLNYINVDKRTDMDVPDNGKDALLPQLGITLPIYRKKYKAMANEANYMQESVRQEKTNTVNQLNTGLEEYYRNYLDAERRIDLYDKLYELSLRAKDILLDSYSTSGKDFEEVLRMERMALKYALELEKARADFNTDVASLHYLMGK